MRGRHDHRHAARDMIQDRVQYQVALGVGQHELLGEVGEDAEPVRAGVDHEIDSAFLPFEIKPAVTVEYRRHHRKYPLVGLPNVRVCHNHLPVFELLAFYRAAPAGGAFSRPRHVAAGH